MEVPSGLYRQNLMEFLKEQAHGPTEVSQEIGGTFPSTTWFLRKGHLCRVCVSRKAGLALKTVMGDSLRTRLLLLRRSLGHLMAPLERWGIRGCRGGAGAGRDRWKEKAPSLPSGFLSQGLGLTGVGILEQTGLLKQSPKHVIILSTGDGQKSCVGKGVAQGGVKES